MMEDKLEEGKLLNDIIKDTKEGLKNLKELMESVKGDSPDNKFDDGLYKLVVSKHSDASGQKAEFTRYGGNLSLLRVIITRTEEQLAEFENEFAQL